MKYLVGGLLVFTLGGCLGAKTVTPEVEYVEGPTRTKVVTETLPAERIEYVPQACLDALGYAARIYSAGADMYDMTNRQLAIISEARQALASSSSNGLTAQENAQRILKGDTVVAGLELSDNLLDFERTKEECEELTQ